MLLSINQHCLHGRLVPRANALSHNQYKHPHKQGLVTVAGSGNDDLVPGTLTSILKQAGLKKPRNRLQASPMSRYLAVIEETPTRFSGYLPDVPGCIATGRTREEVERNIRQAIELHLDGVRADGQPPPKATSSATYVVVAA
jgi:predicted RNase H-like HicB family nuclease